MKSTYTQGNYWYLIIVAIVVILDQITKLLVYTYMTQGYAGEITLLGDFFKLHYLTNPGMAFGVDVAGTYGKWILSLSRILVMGGIGYYLYYIIRTGHARGFIISMSAIMSGAIGNVIDSTFYGVWLDNAPLSAPTPWFHGQVVDMFYIDIWSGFLPDSLPIIGGMHVFLWPIFNIADASIFLSVIYILINQKAFSDTLQSKDPSSEPRSTELSSNSSVSDEEAM